MRAENTRHLALGPVCLPFSRPLLDSICGVISDDAVPDRPSDSESRCSTNFGLLKKNIRNADEWLSMMGITVLATRRIGFIAIIAIAVLVLPTSVALAGSVREYGSMVEYPLVFPVDGLVSLDDTFYAS